MKINIQKGLFRIYKIINVVTPIWFFLWFLDYYGLEDYNAWACMIFFLLLIIVSPWALHLFLCWIINGFNNEE